VDAFVDLRVRPGRVEDVLVQLENVGGVRAAVAVVGAWDVLSGRPADLLGISEEVVRGIEGLRPARPLGSPIRSPGSRRSRPSR
jgi:hypothetical protein